MTNVNQLKPKYHDTMKVTVLTEERITTPLCSLPFGRGLLMVA